MCVPTMRDTPQLTESDFSKEEVAEFHRLMTALLTACKTVGERHAPEGNWVPSNIGLHEQFGESMQVIAHISRQLNQTRTGMRRITGRARERLYQHSRRQPH
ncbi:hypothetical protein GCM10010339_87010 [Streptomyces alanosinicus]|uniref:Uncharacterized protein n=2 Tax=Streptomyces alanosinicus TaxID=68171 RepID=A0A918YTE2_9ACTN|nr:hypothetical protein GCM10010339_87010 [Streptomyces alanosinicus]